MRRHLAITLGAAIIALAPQAVTAKEFVYGSFIGEKGAENRLGMATYIKDVERDTNGSVTWKVLPGGQIVSGRGTLAGIRDRLVDGGLIVQPFTRKELATNNTIFDMAFVGTDTVAVSGASVETTLLDCPECLAEFHDNKAVFLGGYGIAPFKLLCGTQVKSLDDLANRKIRAVGVTSRWIKLLGGVPVSLPGPEAVPALQRGAIDCAAASTLWLTAFGYMDVTKSIIDFTFGQSRGIGLLVMNRDAWNSLTLDEKKVMLKHLPAAQARVTIDGYIKGDISNLKSAADRGITITKGGADFEAKLAQHIKSEQTAVPAALKELGVKDPERIMAAFTKNLAKWEKISAEVGLDVDKFAAAIQREIYDKIDPNKL